MPAKPKIKENIVHYLMYGKTACGKFGGKRPNEWPVMNLWDIHWESITCAECLKHAPKGTQKGMTKEQYDVLRHSLGLNRENEPYRNRYIDEPDAEVPNELVDKAMMLKSEPVSLYGGMCVYQVTPLGKEIALKPFKKG